MSTALLLVALAAPLLADWLDWRRGAGLATLALASSLVIFGYLMSFAVPRRRWAHPSASARYVGGQVAELRSNLLSAVEFSAMASGTATGSEELRQALYRRTASELSGLRLQSLVPYRVLRRPMLLALSLVVANLVAVILIPNKLAHGWSQLFTPAAEAPFHGASLVAEPLVGDLDVRIEFPDYTGRPSVSLPASSGDFEVMPGSRIEIQTRSRDRASSARILFSNHREIDQDLDAALEQEVSVSDGEFLRAEFVVTKESYYRFAIAHKGAHKVEARARHIAIRADKSPSVELYAPADELDVAKIKRLELAYVAEDDFGISKVELVYQAEGDKEYRQSLEIPNLDPSGTAPRSAQLKYLWDLAALPLRPGVQIRYHVEVTDNDNILGPNVGKSREYSLRLFSPRERHEELIARQIQLAENMLALLATRLTGTGGDVAAHRSVLRMAGEVIVEMGSLLAALKGDELASKALLATIESLRNRIDERTRREDTLLSSIESKARKNPSAAESANNSKRLLDSDLTSIADLEDDVLTLSDWLERQELENLLGINDEITASRARLDKLFAEYERTGSPEILAEIERELAALERRLQEMSEKSAGVSEDVLDRFVNTDALQGDEDSACLRKVSELLRAGAAAEAKEQLAKCGEQMDKSAQALEDALKGMRGENFSEAEKLMDDKLDALEDLSQDQEDIARATDEVYESYAKAASAMQNEMSSEAKKHAGDTLAKLRRKIKEVPRSALSPFAAEEYDILDKRLRDAKDMLERGELAEALSAARYANRSLETVQDELQFSLDEGWTREGFSAEKAARSALPLARRLIDQLEEATPKPSEILDKADRKKLEELKRRQKSVRQRSQQLQKELQDQGEKMPGEAAAAMQEGLGKAMQHMGQAEKQMHARDPSSARQEAQEAAKRLQQAKDSAKGAARQKQQQGQATWREEPIRIPGAEDYKAPEKFREEILDAMKDDEAPAGFADQVKRYYKEIIH